MEVGLKLIIVFLLQISPYDKLKIYAILTCGVAILIRITYEFYCKRNFPSVNFQFLWDKIAFKELIGFSSWNLLGCLSGVLRVQGVNVLLNVFFGTIINAAQGIANQVTSAVSGFVTNFQTALNPPIVKYYASNNTEKFTNLVFQGAKFSYYVMFLISLPIILETGYVLKIWLKMTPDYAVLFCQLSLIFCLIDCLSGPLTVATMATGKQMLYQIIVSGSYLVILPMSYILLKLGFPPQTTLFVCIVIAILALFGKLFVLKKLINFSFIHFVNQVLVRVSIVTVVSIIQQFRAKK
ncbi:hypothetical protein FACS189415_6090 [Bacteroidia bacterium]|nr:hypothetical protein FACS189426_21360 [Bacteroidia bacterium]GHT85562.1 hypothetical protein FACS18947_4470 [Bacteroidia bacterium]GHU83557.1 hypothetical protein FACS189415_6090 [Bacteroidia bacterium]